VPESLIDANDIAMAADRLRGRVVRTPLLPLGATGVVLKAESLQPSGAFKLRGAFNSLLVLDDAALRRGVVAHSSGNHAIAVAMACSVLGVHATVVMPEDVPATKLSRTLALGATVELVASDSAERARRAAELADQEGLTPIEPYDSREVLAATGTIAVEILEDLPDAGMTPPVIYVPISGGGLAGGVAAGAKLRDPRVRVVGVEPEVAADALASRRAGHRVALPSEQMRRTIADGLRVQQVGALTWPHLEAFVDDIVTVSEQQIRDTVRRIAAEACLVAEPSGAVPVAAALAGRASANHGYASVAVLTGGNVDAAVLAELLADPRT
jgi:threo-3-hydroxy-L-aspartate ammonia-lyase